MTTSTPITKVLLNNKLMFPSEYVSAAEFLGRDVVLTIAGIRMEDLALKGGKKERKPVMTFRETKKKLVLNKTNAGSIGDMYGNKAELWIGKKVTLYPTTTQCGRDTVDCIRVRVNGAVPRQSPIDRPFDDGNGEAPHDDEQDNDVFGRGSGDILHEMNDDELAAVDAAEGRSELPAGGQSDSPPAPARTDSASGGGERIGPWPATLPDHARTDESFIHDVILQLKPQDLSANMARRSFHARHAPHSWKNLPHGTQNQMYAALIAGEFDFGKQTAEPFGRPAPRPVA